MAKHLYENHGDALPYLRGGIAFVTGNDPFRSFGGPTIAFDKPNEGQAGAGDGEAANDGADDAGAAGDNGGQAGIMAEFQRRKAEQAAAGGDGTDGDGGDGSDGDGSDAGGDDGAEGGEGSAADFKLPAGLTIPDDLKGETDQDTLTNVLTKYQDIEKRYKSLRDRKGDAPDAVDDYKLDLADETAQKIGMKDDDPVLAIARQAAFDHGLTEDQFKGVFGGFIEAVTKSDLIDGEGFVDPENWQKEEFEKLGGAEQAMIKVDHVDKWLQGLKNRHVLSDDQINELNLTANSAAGVEALLKLREMSGEEKIPAGHASGIAPISLEDWEKKVVSERYEHDADYRQKVDQEGRALFGDT